MQLVFIEEVTPSRHLAAAAVGNGFGNRFLSTAPQPYIVGQIRAEALDTLTFVAVTSETVGRWAAKQGFTAFCTFFVILTFRFRKRHNILCYVFHAFFTQSRTPCRHGGSAAFFNGFLNLFRFTAPQPVVVSQIWEAFRAFGI